jgi:hypothetical protein
MTQINELGPNRNSARRDCPVVCPSCGRQTRRRMRGQRYCSKRCRQKANYAKKVERGDFSTRTIALPTTPLKTNSRRCNGQKHCRAAGFYCGMNAHVAAIEAFINETTRCFGAPPASILLRRGETEMEYDNTNRGALFRNDDKDANDNQDRDYSGSLDIEGTEYWLSGWVRISKKSGKKYLSLSIKPKRDKPPATNKSRAADFGDEIAF